MIGRTLIGLGLALALGFAAAGQTVREKPLDDLPAADRGAVPPARTATNPPPPPPVPKAPRVTTRTAPPPADMDRGADRGPNRDADDDDAPPARATPPSRDVAPPARSYEPPPSRRVERAPPAPPARAYEPPPARSAFAANCTQQCHLACEAAFEGCNVDASPAKPECVRKLEACRVQRCSCRMD